MINQTDTMSLEVTKGMTAISRFGQKVAGHVIEESG